MRGLCTVALLGCLSLSGCAARYILGDNVLVEAKEKESLDNLRVYVSNRTITVYERKEFDKRVIRREIEDQSQKKELRRTLTRRKTGGYVGEDLLNGARRIWVSFDRRCRDPDCAYGFVQTEDGRYRLVTLPERADYDAPNAFRSCRIKRHRLELGNLRSLSDNNPVYKLKRKKKKRPKTIFLEVKKKKKKRTEGENQAEPGFD